MAYVGTVCFVDDHGEALGTIRYASAACDDPRELVEKMTADVSAALKRRPSLNVGIVQDGAPEMWNRTREGLQVLRDKGQLGAWHEAIDRYHLMERLAVALKLVEPDITDEERKARLNAWTDLFDTMDTAITGRSRPDATTSSWTIMSASVAPSRTFGAISRATAARSSWRPR
jgi:hypothetical protein